jgi:radical SAM protein (TIGR01212 family)
MLNLERHIPTRWSGKPYNFFGDYLRNRHGTRVFKLPIDAGLTCPNRDGTISEEGCIFCSEEGSASPTTFGITDIIEQMRSARERFRRGNLDTRYVAYFQAYTNTHAPINRLKELYDRAISSPDVIGLMIGTRPDSLPDPVLDLIASYAKNDFELWLEIGMQSAHDRSLRFLKRGHLHRDTEDAVTRAAVRGIPVCVHIILGIPGETWDDMMGTSRAIAEMPVQGIKFHHLHVIAGTGLEKLYRQREFQTLTQKEYISTLCDFMERIPPHLVIHRILGDRDEETLIGPLWGLHKGTVTKALEEEFERRGTSQGFLYREVLEN